VSSDCSDGPTSEVAAAAAAAVAAESAANDQGFKTPTSPSKKTAPTVTVTPPESSPSRSRSTAGGELRDAKKTLQERDKQLNRVSQRSREMNDSAVNFAVVAQGFLELSQKKKR